MAQTGKRRSEQERIDRSMTLYLAGVALFYFFSGATLVLAPTSSALGRIPTPLANPSVIGWSLLIVAALLYQTILRPDWGGFRRFALAVVMGHAFGYFVLGMAISLTTGLDASRPVGWLWILYVHFLAIHTTYDTQVTPAARILWDSARTRARAWTRALAKNAGGVRRG